METTTFSYKFYSGTDKVAWIRTVIEAETESENGPAGSGVTYDSHRVFSDRGLNEWSRASDNTLTRREFDATTGMLEKVTRNADVANLTASTYGLSSGDISGWGRSGDRLATEFALDILGRVVERKTPGGVSAYTIHEIRTNSERPNLYYYAEVTLPYKLAGSPVTFDGPVLVAWMDGGGDGIRTSEYSIDGTATYTPGSLEYTLNLEIARQTSLHTLSGLVEKQRVWHDVRGQWHSTGTDRYYETAIAYDNLGRVQYVTSPTGTVRHHAAYDVFDRLLEVKVGTSTSNTETVVKYFYDHTLDGGGQPVQGAGNGNLTFTRAFTGENGTLAAAHRDTIRTFDYRGRAITVQRPSAPHEFIVYDNLDRVTERATFKSSSAPTGIATPLTDRGLYVKTFYSQRGQVYKQQIAIDPTASSPTYLESNVWHDEVGRTVGEWSPNSGGIKRTLDALGRTVTEYVTDRGNDDLPGASGNYADVYASLAAVLTDDKVLEQVTYRYNSSDRLDLVTRLVRNHDSTATGALSSSSGVTTYVGHAYDDADRQARTVDFGTNQTGFKSGGSQPTWPDGSNPLPNWNTSGYSGRIVTAVEYNERGLADFATDPLGRKTKYFYDDLDRRTAGVENYVNASIGWTGTVAAGRWTFSGLNDAEPDTDRATSFAFNGVGNVVRQVAHLPTGTSEKVQVTEYAYGVTKGSVSTATDSLVYHNDLLAEVRYPDESTGAPGSTNAYKVKYAYSVLGEVRSLTDQNQSRHEYTRDVHGRVTHDVAAALGTDINGNIRRIQVAYDGLGRLTDAESYDATTSGNVKNGLRFTYSPLWQVKKVYQDHNGAVGVDGSGNPTGDTVVLTYGYADAAPASGTAGSNFGRVTSMTLPYGTQQQYAYDSSGSTNDRVSRVYESKYQPAGSSAISFLKYGYIGLGMPAEVDYAAIDVQLDFTLAHNGKRLTQGYNTGTSGEYPGYDEFGRVIRQVWADGNLTQQSPPTTVPNYPPIFEETYTYDRASNRLTRTDARPGASWGDRDFDYAYDGVDRLTEAKRGVSGGTWTAGKLSQKWALDMLGSWTELKTDTNGNGSYADSGETQTRTHNEANEIVTLDPDGTGGLPSVSFTFDDAGNAKTRGGKTYKHDAWNRLVKVHWPQISSTYASGEYEYYGLHWRSVARADTYTLYPDGVLDQQRVFYYDAAWRLVEERIDDGYNVPATAGLDRIAEEFWGTRYIDDPVLRRILFVGDDETPAGEYHHLTDVQFSTRAMMSGSALVERATYRAYGWARHHYRGDADGDGDVDSADSTLVGSLSGQTIGGGTYKVECDLDRNGVINSTDTTLVGTSKTGLFSGWHSDPAIADNPFGFDGYVFAREVDHHVARFRWYDPDTGRWLEPDPLGYIDGVNRYQYSRSAPIDYLDPFGLCPPYDKFKAVAAAHLKRVLKQPHNTSTTSRFVPL